MRPTPIIVLVICHLTVEVCSELLLCEITYSGSEAIIICKLLLDFFLKKIILLGCKLTLHHLHLTIPLNIIICTNFKQYFCILYPLNEKMKICNTAVMHFRLLIFIITKFLLWHYSYFSFSGADILLNALKSVNVEYLTTGSRVEQFMTENLKEKVRILAQAITKQQNSLARSECQKKMMASSRDDDPDWFIGKFIILHFSSSWLV